jgi:excisionase family DNA binding protein
MMDSAEHERAESLPQLLDLRDVRLACGVSLDTVYGWIREGRLPAVRLGKRKLHVAEADLRDFIDANRWVPTPDAGGVRAADNGGSEETEGL